MREYTSSIINYKVNEVKQTTKETELEDDRNISRCEWDYTLSLLLAYLREIDGLFQRRWVHPNLVAPGVLAVSKRQSTKVYWK